MKVSVVICTWNRAALLDQTLSSIRQLAMPPDVEWELLVVNNNCTDDTDEVLSRHAGHLPLRRLFEPKPGHSNARNCAVSNVRSDLLLWTDDDVLVDPDWLVEYVQAAQAHPQVTFFGGTVTPWFEATPPKWITRNLPTVGYCFALCNFGSSIRPLAPEEAPVGANMAIRTAALRGFRFDANLGRLLKEQRSNDDTELIVRLRAAGHHGLWVGTARVQHFLPTARLTPQFVYSWFRWQGRVLCRTWKGMEKPKLLFGVPRWVLRKYWMARLKAAFLRPIKNSAWLTAFVDSARCRGCIDYFVHDHQWS